VVGSLFGVLTGVLFSFVVIFGKGLLHGQPPFTLLVFRFGIAALILGVVTVASGRPLLPERGERLGSRPPRRRYGTESRALLGGGEPRERGGGHAAVLPLPVWVMLVAIGLDRRAPAGALILALALAIGGERDRRRRRIGGGHHPLGIALSLTCAIAYTAYLTGAARVVRRTNPLTTATWLGAGVALANLTYAAILQGWSMPTGEYAALRVLGMGVSTAGAFVCLIASLQRIGAVRNAILGVIEPLMVAVLAAVF
jgi:drug/metabolite transporter (DMT)-like permease